jgi:glyoxylase-like metal-dependent hydrolase (beta-lactamase superfamily II)/rhodanese-related sulfurtransferase
VSLKIINLDTPTLGDRSYLAHDGKTAVVVDPQRDIDRIQQLLAKESVSLGAVVETHMHNDYVSGGLVLANEHGAKYIVHEQDPVNFARTSVKDEEIIPIGSFALQALHTPGHTFTHLSYALLTGEDKYQGVFTGGSMLHGSTGRPDLLGSDQAETLARLQHGSANRLADLLEDHVSVHPTHGFGSFCAATATSGDASTIKDEKLTNPALLFNVDDFVAQTLAGLDVFPAYYQHMGPANLAGAGPIDLSELSRMSSQEVLKAIESGAWVVDIRNRDIWAKAHVAGSLSFGLDGSFATYLGWIFPYEEKLYLLSDKAEDINQAQRELVRIGIDRPQAAYVGDFSEFENKKSTKTVTFNDVVEALKDPKILVLDVRRNSEREASHIQGTSHIPLHDLKKRVNELAKDKEIWVHCAGAYRAAAAVGILENAKLNAVLINQAYEDTLQVKQLPIVLGHKAAGPVAPSDQKVNA